MTELSILLPAYEEAENLDILLPQIHGCCQNLGIRYEIIVIDKHHSDPVTRSVCESHKCSYLNREGGDSYGDAIRTGIANSTGKHVCCMDADGSHDPKYLAAMWAQRDGYDLIIGSRYVSGGETENPYVLIILSRLVNIIFRVVLGLKCQDVSNSFRLYDGTMLRELVLRCNHFDIVEEILIKIISLNPGLRIKEIPVVFLKRGKGKTKRRLWLFVLNYAYTLMKLLWFKHSARRKPVQPYHEALTK